MCVCVCERERERVYSASVRVICVTRTGPIQSVVFEMPRYLLTVSNLIRLQRLLDSQLIVIGSGSLSIEWLESLGHKEA